MFCNSFLFFSSNGWISTGGTYMHQNRPSFRFVSFNFCFSCLCERSMKSYVRKLACPLAENYEVWIFRFCFLVEYMLTNFITLLSIFFHIAEHFLLIFFRMIRCMRVIMYTTIHSKISVWSCASIKSLWIALGLELRWRCRQNRCLKV